MRSRNDLRIADFELRIKKSSDVGANKVARAPMAPAKLIFTKRHPLESRTTLRKLCRNRCRIFSIRNLESAILL